MITERRLDNTDHAPLLTRGFLGPGHLARAVVSLKTNIAADPFLMVMEDHLDLGHRPIGAPHPHAGFETITLILSGSIYDRHEGGLLKAGDLQWLTAGSDVIHNENTEARGYVQLLQLWLTLPKNQRWIAPSARTFRKHSMPVRTEAGVQVLVYSGASGATRASTPNHVPITILDIALAPYAQFAQDFPAEYTGFVYLLEGAAQFGPDNQLLQATQIGWLEPEGGSTDSVLRMSAGINGARLLFFAAQPQRDPLAIHGPFVGDTRSDISRLYTAYNEGQFARLSRLRPFSTH